VDWARAISNGTIRFYEAIRSKKADEAATDALRGDLSELRGRKYALVVTFRRNGEAVPTPVWFGLAEDRLYFRSVSNLAKLRRIAEHPTVLVAPCTANGRPTGPAVYGAASLLTTPSDQAVAEAAIRRNYGLGRRIYARLIGRRVAGTYVEIRPLAAGN
jgi:PPOX class probable F420-dependent enzyme